MRALLVDDKPGIRRMLRHFLELHTSLDVVAEASSSEQALAVTATVKPDVVIMDIELPGMNGTSATRELRRRHPEMRALAFSSICDDATREAEGSGSRRFPGPPPQRTITRRTRVRAAIRKDRPVCDTVISLTREPRSDHASAFPGRGSGRSLRHSSVRQVVKDERAASHGRRES